MAGVRAGLRVVVLIVAMSAGTMVGRNASATSTRVPPPLPTPVPLRDTPEGITLDDPSFTPLPGARADFGRLGGTVYQIEVPDHWNGRLVLFMHGYGELATHAGASAPHIRRYLIGRGFAWGASSFSSTSLIPGRAADETAGLWDYFAQKYGRPVRSYVTGGSMGGAATNIAAERYGNRFDGALALSGAASQGPAFAITGDFFAAGAYAAGLTQADYDGAASISQLVADRILPALRDPARHALFERLVIQDTGGPRAFDRLGFEAEEDTNWRRGTLLVEAGIADNRTTRYPDPAFDHAAIRFRTNPDLQRAFLAGNETTGDLQIPLVTLHTTGDGQVPINQAQLYQREVNASGRSKLLVQRVVRDPGHLGFTDQEWAANLEALVRWVEHGGKPTGTTVMTPDLRRLDHTFEISPRVGTQQGDQVPGAGARVVLRGTATLDGSPLDTTYLGAVVIRKDGLVGACQLSLPPVVGGHYRIMVMAHAEGAGCGARGATIILWTFAGSHQLYSREAIPWPGDSRTITTAITFSTNPADNTAPQMASFSGEAFRRDGTIVGPGTQIEAFVGPTRCGLATVRRTGSFSGFILSVSPPTTIPACQLGAPLSFRVNGTQAIDTAVNGASHNGFDLTIP